MSDAIRQVTARDSPVQEDGEDDAALIARSIDTPDCFAVLFDRHAPAIYRYVARRLGPDAADDLVAEAFLVAFQRRGGYDSTQAEARPWLYGIATNLISRRRRDEMRFFRAIARRAGHGQGRRPGSQRPARGSARRPVRRVSRHAASRRERAHPRGGRDRPWGTGRHRGVQAGQGSPKTPLRAGR